MRSFNTSQFSAFSALSAVNLLTVLVVAVGASWWAVVPADRFDHPEHAGLFPTCTTCHAGVLREASPWPDAASCASCHDGAIEERTDWQPPAELPRTNLRFSHTGHAEDTLAACVDCHADAGAPWMTVRVAAVERCLECHGIAGEHLAAPDTACATCHVTLAQATRLAAEDIAGFAEPPSHVDRGFAGAEGHGAAAQADTPVAASCATCHAQDFCLICHVDAPEQPAIQALARDARSLVHTAALSEPPSHEAPGFLTAHGDAARRSPTDCATCHTQESCAVCHLARPAVIADLPRATADRGRGAVVTREPPAAHGNGYADRHGPIAAAVPQSCAGCHVQANCLECHQPSAARTGSYHPADFLTRHPAAAYARETDCVDCHNPAGFCASCHAGAGLVTGGPFRSGAYHDAKRFFIAGHGQAARQSLETCVGCHVERDCLPCHSAVGGRRFNPHGPGFDAARLKRMNPGTCTVCHGANIP